MSTKICVGSKWKQLKCTPTDKWMNKSWHIHDIDDYAVIKKNKTLTCEECNNMDSLRNSMLSETRQTQKITCCMCGSTYEKFLENKTESRYVVVSGGTLLERGFRVRELYLLDGDNININSNKSSSVSILKMGEFFCV